MSSVYKPFGYRGRALDNDMWSVDLFTIDTEGFLVKTPGIPVKQTVIMTGLMFRNLQGVTKDFMWHNYAEDLRDFVIVTAMQLERLVYLRDLLPNGGTGVYGNGISFRHGGLRNSVTTQEVLHTIRHTLCLYSALAPLFAPEIVLEEEHAEDTSLTLPWDRNQPEHVRLNIWADLNRAFDLDSLLTDEDPRLAL